MRNAELALFSVGPNQTLSDYFAVHHAPVFDVLAAIPYAIFWMFPLVYAGYLFYADRPRLSFYLWSLFLAQAVVWFCVVGLPSRHRLGMCGRMGASSTPVLHQALRLCCGWTTYSEFIIFKASTAAA